MAESNFHALISVSNDSEMMSKKVFQKQKDK